MLWYLHKLKALKCYTVIAEERLFKIIILNFNNDSFKHP